MKRLFLPLALASMLAGCASPGYEHEGLRETQQMTDMDGRPIAPYHGSVAPNIGLGLGIGSWGHGGGAGIGIGTGW
ncbi:hypothetical protein [Noviherbaspirillum massiliense]|uniref:hypothetical protein n=1 Tax=Noviherbaspirillum massiliense TaxID=1465823 RepID=UPI00031637C0|nr:hypothetical protein [Noviherbaspirillum massiliense]